MVAEGKETREFDGRHSFSSARFAAILLSSKAWKGDRWGNLIYRNFAQLQSHDGQTAADYVIAEVEQPSN